MTNRTVCCLAVSFTAGLFYGRNPGTWVLLPFLCFLVFRTFFLIQRSGRGAVSVAVLHMLLCMALFAGGTYRYLGQQEQFEAVREYAEEQESLQVRGEIYWKEEKQEQFIYYLKDAGMIRGGQYVPCGNIQVYSSTASYKIGNCIQAVGSYRAFQRPRNEGNFNEEQYYYSKKIGLRMTAWQEQLLSGGEKKGRQWLWNLRTRLEQVFQEHMTERTGGIMANMTLGSRKLADQEVKSLYQKAGISHVLAVSGLHVSIFGMGLYRLLRRVYCPKTLSALLAAFVVYSFGLLTGMELSTTRAVVMFLLMMAAGITGCTYDSVTALSLSALLQLWNNPYGLWYAGFLLSYTAVLGAVVIAGILREQGAGRKQERKSRQQENGGKGGVEEKKWMGQKLPGKLMGKLLDTMKVSLCIQAATLPVLLFFYYEVPAYSVLINGCVLPFMGILLFLGAAGGILGLFSGGAACAVLKAPIWILSGCEGICRFFTELPGNNIITGKPSMEKIIWYYILLALLLYLVTWRKKKNYFLLWLGLAVLLCCGNGQKGTEVDFLDVGQGDGIFLQSREGRGVFIDGGSTDVGKVGTYRILPFLKCRGMKEIQLWFVSHADADHISGLREVLEAGYPVRNLVFAEGIVKDEAWEALAELAEEKGSHIYYLKAGDRITLDEMRFTVLYPWEEKTDRNEASMVLLAELEGMTGIFSGDIGAEQERELVERGELQGLLEEPVTFCKAAHHGSDSSNSLEFLELLSPRLTVVSCGADNSYGHPGENALERMAQSGSRILFTMENGQIRLRKEGEEVLIWKFQN